MMKKIMQVLCLTLWFGMTTGYAFAQCNTEIYTEKALRVLPQGFTFVKS
jgi:hypothetical protein